MLKPVAKIGKGAGMRIWPIAKLMVILSLVACAPHRPPPPPRPVVPWGAINFENKNPSVVTADGRRVSTLPTSGQLAGELRRNEQGVYEYPAISLSGGGSHGAWGAGFLTGWAETGTRPQFRIVTAMSAGALLATSAYLGPKYDYLMSKVFVESTQKDLFTVGPASVVGGLFGRGYFANINSGRRLLESLYSDAVIDAVAKEYLSGRRLYFLTANFDDNVPTIWDMGFIASSSEPDRYDRFRQIIQAAIAVPAAFPPVYFKVKVDGKSYGQMHLDAGTNFVFLLDFMVGQDVAALAKARRLSNVEGVIYVVMNTQEDPGFKTPPSGAPLDLVSRAFQRIGRFASYGALDRLWIYATERGIRLQIAKIPEDLDIPFDLFEFPQPDMAKLFEQGRAAARDYKFSDRPPGLVPPPGETADTNAGPT